MGCSNSSEKLTIEEKESYDDGSPKLLITYKMKKGERIKHGWDISWYKDGKEMYKALFHEGKVVGESKGWYEDGIPKFVKTYIDGQIVTHTIYHKNGNVAKTISYVNDKKHGPSHRWNEKGDLIEKGEWVRDEPSYIFIYEDGSLSTSRYYIYDDIRVMEEVVQLIKDSVSILCGFHYMGEGEAVFVTDRDGVKQTIFMVKFERKKVLFNAFKARFKESDWGKWKDI